MKQLSKNLGLFQMYFNFKKVNMKARQGYIRSGQYIPYNYLIMNSKILEQCVLRRQKISNLCENSQKCRSNKKITLICINSSCDKDMLHCQAQECSFCSQHRLNGCQAIQLSFFTRQLKTRVETKRTMIQKMTGVENQMIVALMKHRETLKKCSKQQDFSEDQMQVLNIIFNNQYKDIYSRKKLIFSYAKRLKSERQFIVAQQSYLFRHFREQIQQQTRHIANLEKSVISKLFDKKIKIQSKIILSNNFQALAFINNSFDSTPKSWDLVFRASENQFSAKKFNQIVSKIKNTFVLAKTQFGKIIAGYCPLERLTSIHKWSKIDPNNQSFLLSINLQKKMKIVKGQPALACSSSFGPIFGQGSKPDFLIADRCSSRNESFINVFGSYECEKFFKAGREQEFYQQVCGASKGNNFKVIEYQVFKVYL